MSWQRGYGEATPGTDARPVNRGRVVTLSQGELSDMLDQAGRKAQRAFKSALVIGTVLGITLGFGATRAFGHGWYSQACCSGKDCAPIAASAVTWTPNGWRVALNPGQHPMVTLAPMVELVPFDAVLPSQDDQWHACVRTDSPSPSAVTPAERIICLYIPEGQFGS